MFCMCGVWKMCFSGQMSIKANFCVKLTNSYNRSPPVNHHRLCFNMTIMWELTVLQPSPFLRATGLLPPWFLWFSGLPVASQLSPISRFNPLQHSSPQRRRYDPMLALSPLKVECSRIPTLHAESAPYLHNDGIRTEQGPRWEPWPLK